MAIYRGLYRSKIESSGVACAVVTNGRHSWRITEQEYRSKVRSPEYSSLPTLEEFRLRGAGG